MRFRTQGKFTISILSILPSTPSQCEFAPSKPWAKALIYPLSSCAMDPRPLVTPSVFSRGLLQRSNSSEISNNATNKPQTLQNTTNINKYRRDGAGTAIHQPPQHPQPPPSPRRQSARATLQRPSRPLLQAVYLDEIHDQPKLIRARSTLRRRILKRPSSHSSKHPIQIRSQDHVLAALSAKGFTRQRAQSAQTSWSEIWGG